MSLGWEMRVLNCIVWVWWIMGNLRVFGVETGIDLVIGDDAGDVSSGYGADCDACDRDCDDYFFGGRGVHYMSCDDGNGMGRRTY